MPNIYLTKSEILNLLDASEKEASNKNYSPKKRFNFKTIALKLEKAKLKFTDNANVSFSTSADAISLGDE